MNLLIRILASAVAVIITAYILPGVHVSSFITAVIVAAVLAFFNAILKPVLVILTIPITLVTLGLFLLVINALLIELAAYTVTGFDVDGFWWALLFSLILSVLNSLFNTKDKSSKPERY
jgi:putative membrane protein